MEGTIKNVIDGSFTAGALSSPWWLDRLTTYGSATIIVLGVAVGIIRLAIAVYDWRHRQPRKKGGA